MQNTNEWLKIGLVGAGKLSSGFAGLHNLCLWSAIEDKSHDDEKSEIQTFVKRIITSYFHEGSV